MNHFIAVKKKINENQISMGKYLTKNKVEIIFVEKSIDTECSMVVFDGLMKCELWL